MKEIRQEFASLKPASVTLDGNQTMSVKEAVFALAPTLERMKKRRFGTQEIIENGFDISTTTLPKDRLHKPGGMYDKKVADGFEVLEIPKGTWVEAIFAKPKPEMEKPKLTLQQSKDEELPDDDYENNDEEDEEPIEPDEFSDDDITEDNYRTTFEIESDPDEEADAMADYDGSEP